MIPRKAQGRPPIRTPKENTALPKPVDSPTDTGGSGTDSIERDSAGARDEPKGRSYGRGPAAHLAGRRQRLQPERRAGQTREVQAARVLPGDRGDQRALPAHDGGG